MVLGLKSMGKLVTSRKNSILDTTKVLHGSQTQTYGETSYFKKNLSTGQNQGLAWSLDSNLWGNQLLQERSKYQTKPRPCMVLGLKPMGKLTTSSKSLGGRQNPNVGQILGPQPLKKLARLSIHASCEYSVSLRSVPRIIYSALAP